jgi:hypothetical protein
MQTGDDPTGQPTTSTAGVTGVAGVPLDLRFTAYSTMIHTECAHMLLFDGDPAKGSPAIADQSSTRDLMDLNGTSIWFTWTSTTPGLHHLFAVLIEGPQQNKAGAELDVNVIPAQPGNH